MEVLRFEYDMGVLNDKTEIVYRGCGTGDLRRRPNYWKKRLASV